MTEQEKIFNENVPELRDAALALKTTLYALENLAPDAAMKDETFQGFFSTLEIISKEIWDRANVLGDIL